MWRKILRWLLTPILEEAEPKLAEWINNERETLIITLKEADGKILARHFCEKIRESL